MVPNIMEEITLLLCKNHGNHYHINLINYLVKDTKIVFIIVLLYSKNRKSIRMKETHCAERRDPLDQIFTCHFETFTFENLAGGPTTVRRNALVFRWHDDCAHSSALGTSNPNALLLE